MFMSKSNCIHALMATSIGVGLTGCQNLPGSPESQGAVIGGLGGAAAGGAIGHTAGSAALGGLLGVGAGYIVGANQERLASRDQNSAAKATQLAQTHPATPQLALNAPTADLNGDGYVTLDEVVAMKQAGLTDDQMLQRMQATNEVFGLSPQQQSYLRSQGVSDYVINQMQIINQQQQPLSTAPVGSPGGVISQPR
jgi:hypothetical protein